MTNEASNSSTFKRFTWPVLIIGLLATHTILMIVCVMIATRDRSFAVKSDYYVHAVNWDKEQAIRRASEKLGWQISVNPSSEVTPLGVRQVSFRLTDAAGHAIPGATLSARYFHHAHAHDAASLTATADRSDPAHFGSEVQMRRAGTWQFDFEVKATGQTFIQSQTLEVANAH